MLNTLKYAIILVIEENYDAIKEVYGIEETQLSVYKDGDNWIVRYISSVFLTTN